MAQAWAGYKIVLKNGQSIDAENFTIENSKITLKYTVGEASFPMNMVKAITDQNGNGDFMSGPAKQVAKPAEPQKAAPDKSAVPPQEPAMTQKESQPPVPQAKGPAEPPAQDDKQMGLPGVIGEEHRDTGEDQNLEPLPPDEDLPPPEEPPQQ